MRRSIHTARTIQQSLNQSVNQTNNQTINQGTSINPDLFKSGKRTIKAIDDSFNFSCTACGKCCHKKPASVLLDSYDIWLISRSKDLNLAGQSNDLSNNQSNNQSNQPSTRHLHSQYRRAFSYNMAAIAENLTIKQSNNQTNNQPISQSGYVPAAMFSMRSTTGNCHFAASVPYQPNNQTNNQTKNQTINQSNNQPKLQSIDDTIARINSRIQSNNQAVSRPVSPPVKQSKSFFKSDRRGLTCRLGRPNQPMACALYPLGEMDQIVNQSTDQLVDQSISQLNQQSTDQSTNQTNIPSYFSLDPSCEGVRDVDQSINQPANRSIKQSNSQSNRSINQYLQSQDYHERRSHWLWFRQLMKRISENKLLLDPPDASTISQSNDQSINQSIDQSTDQSINQPNQSINQSIIFDSLVSLLYDFDSLPYIQKQLSINQSNNQSNNQLSEWLIIRSAIESGVDRLIEIHQSIDQSIDQSTSNLQQLLIDEGLAIDQKLKYF